MLLLFTDSDGRDLSSVWAIKDVSREGSSITKLELFDKSGKSMGTMEVEKSTKLEILPNVT